MFLYMNKVIDQGMKKTLEVDDLYAMEETMQFTYLYPRFKAFYETMKRKQPTVQLGTIYRKFFFWGFFKTGAFQLTGCVFDLGIPLMLKYMIDWLNEEDPPYYIGLLYATGISICYLMKVTFIRKAFASTNIDQYKTGIVLRGLIFEKISKLSREGIANLDLGNLTNILTNDTFRLQLMVRLMMTSYGMPLMAGTGFVYSLIYFNWLAVLFPLFFLVSIAIIVWSNKLLFKYQRQMIGFTDMRGKLIAECLGNIKNIKFECWETITMDRLKDYRREESKNLFSYLFTLNLLCAIFDTYTPLFMLTFLTIYSINYGEIPLDRAYLLITLSNMMYQPVKAFITVLDSFASVKLALKRINKVLEIPEDTYQIQDDTIQKGVVEMSNLSVGWRSKELVYYFGANQDPKKTCLRNLQFSFNPGKLYAIVGKVGAGKTAFLNTVLGEMCVKTGSIKKNGSLAFVAQSPFLINATLKENITFGEPLDDERYRMCLVKCRLVDDIRILPAGDATEIGERGVNLSGGQKQRICLARSLYADKDIYLIDDTLSALDSQVAKSVFNEVILGELKAKGKTIILVTHALAVLSQCDHIMLLDNGEVTLQGTFDKIKNDPKYISYSENDDEEEEHDPAKMIIDKGKDKDEEISEKAAPTYDFDVEMKLIQKIIHDKEADQRTATLARLTVAEKKKQGRVDPMVYGKFLQAFNSFLFITSFVLFFIYIFLRNASDFWIGVWSNKRWDLEIKQYREVYMMMIASLILICFLRSWILASGQSMTGSNMTRKMMASLFKRPIGFFEANPIGMIVNRLTKDMLEMDTLFNIYLQHFMANVSLAVSIIFVVSYSVPFMIPVFLFVICMCVRYFRIVTLVTSDLKRITQVATTPVISNTMEMFNGILTIRGYNQVQTLMNKFRNNLLRMMTSELHERHVESWTFYRIELLSVLVVVFTTYFSFFIKFLPLKSLLIVQNLSLAISWSAVSSDFIAFLLLTTGEMNKGMGTIERMLEISESKDLEPNHLNPKPPKGWPKTANISIRNLQMRYRKNLPFVLDGLNLEIKPNEKIGIVGRTGSGKSSFILALMRIIEIENGEEERAYIKIDGVAINRIGLRYSRRAVTLIPQDPFVLSGTIRTNVDPYFEHTNEEVIHVLRKTQLLGSLMERYEALVAAGSVVSLDLKTHKKSVKSGSLLKEKVSEKDILSMIVEPGGSNLSQGQRQLLCIGRALMKKPKILLMDEATASIDSRTDEIIQTLIKTEFKDSTILTIAHRLNTIIQYDKILSLKHGKVMEFDRPSKLLRDESTYFCNMVREYGDEFYKQMLELADEAAQQAGH
jgi:ABC-type multidrug transport system fused ATPase/permease subunit